MRGWFVFLLLALISPAGFACGCSKPQTPEEVRYFVHMFKGKVLKVRSFKDYPFRQTVDFETLEHIHGTESHWIKVTFGGPTSCDQEQPDFKVGQVYLISDYEVYSTREYVGAYPVDKSQPLWQYNANYCSLREHVSDGEGEPELMSKANPSIPASDWRTTDLLYVARDLDVTSFPNSIGPRRRPEAKTLWQYGFKNIVAKPGIVEFTNDEGGWYFAVEMIAVHGDVKELCFSDKAMNHGTYNTRTRINVRRSARGYYEAVEPSFEGEHSC